jgi:hypothetical protein
VFYPVRHWIGNDVRAADEAAFRQAASIGRFIMDWNLLCLRMEAGGRRGRRPTLGFDLSHLSQQEKRGVPTHHVNMPPGNSFPQICVVSGNKIVEND